MQLLSFPAVLAVIGRGHAPLIRLRLGTEEDKKKDEDRDYEYGR
jgi:hypothetical protein